MNHFFLTSALMLTLSSPLVAQDQISVKGTVKDSVRSYFTGCKCIKHHEQHRYNNRL